MRIASAALAPLLALPAIASAGQQAASTPTATFDHDEASSSPPPAERSYALTLNDGDAFLVTIQRTCEDAFTYAIRGILKTPEPPASARSIAPNREHAPKPLADKNIGPIKPQERYGGYIVDVILKSDPKPCGIYTEVGATTPANPQPANVVRVTSNGEVSYEAGSKKYTMEEAHLIAAHFFIAVTTDEWNYSISGGFAFSAPGDRHYFLAPKEGSDKVKIVTRDKNNEADAIATAGAFVHLFRSTGFFHTVAPTFGISVETDEKVSYFGGLGWRLGRVATLMGGVSLNQITALPSGVAEGSETENGELLASPPTVSKIRFMVGISFAFLPSGDRLRKPFAGEEKSPGEGK